MPFWNRTETFLQAAEYGKLEKVKEYINSGIDKEAKNISGWMALHFASRNGHLKIVQYLIETCHVDKEAQTNLGLTALHIASENGRLEIVKYLIEKCQVDKEAKDINGSTALYWASRDGHLKIVQYLIETCNVDKEAENNSGMMAYDIAVACNESYVVQYLQKLRSFFKAAKEGNLVKVKYCIDNGIDKEAKSKNGETALHVASENGHLKIVQYLIETSHVDKEAKNNYGWMVLHWASWNGHLEIVQYLIETCHVDKEAKTNDDQTAYDIAVAYNKSEVAQYLQSSILHLGDSHPEPLVVTSVSSMATVPTFKLNETWTMLLQNENQSIVKRLSQLDSSLQFIDERRDLLDLIVVEKCTTIEEQNEQSAILASPKHRDFYLLLQRKLKCMIKSCETLSTGMVEVAGGDMRAFCAKTISEHGYNIFKETKVGFLIASALEWGKKNLPVIPFIDTIGSVFQVIVALKDDRDRYMGLARVADFATMACLPHYGATSLDVTIEKVARHFVRARIGSPSCKFVEKRDQFGKLKQFMINLLAYSGNTPAKEQASKAADCVFAHIMKPSEDSILVDVLNDSICDVGLAEALAATVLDIEIEELRKFAAVSTESQSSVPNIPSVSAVNEGPSIARVVIRDEQNLDSIQQGDENDELDVQSQLRKMNREIEYLKKKGKDSKSKHTSEGGLMYADEYEEDKDAVQNLSTTVNYLRERELITEKFMTDFAEILGDLGSDMDQYMELILQQMSRQQKAQFLRQQEQKKKKWETEKEERSQARIAGDDGRIKEFKMEPTGVWSWYKKSKKRRPRTGRRSNDDGCTSGRQQSANLST